MKILGYISLEQFHATAQYHWHVWLSTINDWKWCCRVTWLQLNLKTDGSIFCIFWSAVCNLMQFAIRCNLQFNHSINCLKLQCGLQWLFFPFTYDFERDLNPWTEFTSAVRLPNQSQVKFIIKCPTDTFTKLTHTVSKYSHWGRLQFSPWNNYHSSKRVNKNMGRLKRSILKLKGFGSNFASCWFSFTLSILWSAALIQDPERGATPMRYFQNTVHGSFFNQQFLIGKTTGI